MKRDSAYGLLPWSYLIVAISMPVLCAEWTRVAWLESQVASFRFWNGVPARLVPDNLKDDILKPDLYDPRFNRGYEKLAHHYNCFIDLARRFRVLYAELSRIV